MFIKVFVPNANGKIELTVQELESLLKQAADNAVVEDRANRPYNWGTLNQPIYKEYIDTGVDPGDVNKLAWTKVTCLNATDPTLLKNNELKTSTIKGE